MTTTPTGPRLLGLGDNTVDTYVDEGLQFPGGNAVNVAVLAHRLGIPAAYLGCLGTDSAGDLIANALAEEGIDTSRVRRIPGRNARAFIRHEDGDRTFLPGWAGVRGRYGLVAEDLVYVAGFDAVHSSIFSDLDAELPRLRPVARLLSYDFSDFWSEEVFERVLPWVDIAFVSAPGRDDQAVADVLATCVAGGARIAVATLGVAGSMALTDRTFARQGVAEAAVVDTLGAGDGFIAAFLTSVLRGSDAGIALAAGAAFAGEVCGRQGAFGHAAPWRGAVPGSGPEDS